MAVKQPIMLLVMVVKGYVSGRIVTTRARLPLPSLISARTDQLTRIQGIVLQTRHTGHTHLQPRHMPMLLRARVLLIQTRATGHTHLQARHAAIRLRARVLLIQTSPTGHTRPPLRHTMALAIPTRFTGETWTQGIGHRLPDV